jgi:hypothetical protein
VGSLPFLYTADLIARGGAVIEEAVPCSVWPASNSRSATSGEVFDHSGEASLEFKDALAEANRALVIADGPMAGTYNIVAATPQPFVPHVGLELRIERPT